jgi:hypothetical protein
MPRSRSQGPRDLRRGSVAARFLELRATFPPGDGWTSVVNAVYCRVYVSATGRFPVQRSHTGCGVSEYDR